MGFDLPSLGWDDVLADAYAEFDRPGHRPGRVAGIDPGVCTVLVAGGPVRASLAGAMLAAAAGDPAALPCPGDWVVVRLWPDAQHTVEAVLPRRTTLAPAGTSMPHTDRVLAANMDTVAVIEALGPAMDPGRIDRLLVLARGSGAQVMVVLTKADLIVDPASITAQVARRVAGVRVQALSGITGAGLEPLRPLVAPGRTLGLLGPPGSGKSTLVDALAGTTVLGSRRTGRRRGSQRRAVACRGLVPLPCGGAVLATSGIDDSDASTGPPGLISAAAARRGLRLR